MADWYFTQQGERKGPVSDNDLKQLVSSGQLKPTDLLWKKGMASWAAACEVEGFFDEPPPLPSELPLGAAYDGPMGLIPNGEGKPLALVPCSLEDYSPEWEWIKQRLVERGLSYMIDTPEKMTKMAKSIGFLIGYGTEKLAWRIVSWLLFRER